MGSEMCIRDSCQPDSADDCSNHDWVGVGDAFCKKRGVSGRDSSDVFLYVHDHGADLAVSIMAFGEDAKQKDAWHSDGATAFDVYWLVCRSRRIYRIKSL